VRAPAHARNFKKIDGGGGGGDIRRVESGKIKRVHENGNWQQQKHEINNF